jgi:hypothetical protein
VVYLVGLLSGHKLMLCRMNSVLPLDKSEMLHLAEQRQGDQSQNAARLVTLSGPQNVMHFQVWKSHGRRDRL